MRNAFLTLAVLAASSSLFAGQAVCPVLGGPVDSNSPKVMVHDHEYQVCCSDCLGKLKANPDKYLRPDGTPKNASVSSGSHCG